MKYKQTKQYRLKNFDYSGEGEYFITVCIKDRKSYFGKIRDGKIILSKSGKIVERVWNEVPGKFNDVKLDVYQVMPDHFHGIIIIKSQKNFINEIPTFKSGIKNNPMELKSNTLGKIIRWFKGRVKFEINQVQPGFNWQNRFYDRVIRNEKEYYFIQEYIINNPLNWGEKILSKYFM